MSATAKISKPVFYRCVCGKILTCKQADKHSLTVGHEWKKMYIFCFKCQTGRVREHTSRDQIEEFNIEHKICNVSSPVPKNLIGKVIDELDKAAMTHDFSCFKAIYSNISYDTDGLSVTDVDVALSFYSMTLLQDCKLSSPLVTLKNNSDAPTTCTDPLNTLISIINSLESQPSCKDIEKAINDLVALQSKVGRLADCGCEIQESILHLPVLNLDPGEDIIKAHLASHTDGAKLDCYSGENLKCHNFKLKHCELEILGDLTKHQPEDDN